MSKLRPHEANDEERFPARDARFLYDFGSPTALEWQVDEIIGHRWVHGRVEFQIKWNLGEVSWADLTTCQKLAALDAYLELQGVSDWQKLPRQVARTS